MTPNVEFTLDDTSLVSKREVMDADDENEAATLDFIDRIVKLDARETEACIHCGKHIERMEQIGRCTYARPCGCRLWQGKIPKAWQT